MTPVCRKDSAHEHSTPVVNGSDNTSSGYRESIRHSALTVIADDRSSSSGPPTQDGHGSGDSSGVLSVYSSHSRAASSLSTHSSTHLHRPTNSQSSIASSVRYPYDQAPHSALSDRLAHQQLTRSVDSSAPTSNESSSLLSWRSDLDDLHEEHPEYRVAVVADSSRSRSSSNAQNAFGTERDALVPKLKSSHSRFPSRTPSISSLRPASPTKIINTVPNNALQVSRLSRGSRTSTTHTRESSVSSISSMASSRQQTSNSRANLPIGGLGTSITSSPPKPLSSSPEKRSTLLRRGSSIKSASVSSPNLRQMNQQPMTSKQQEADLLRAVRAMEEAAAAAHLPPATPRHHHQSLTPASARALSRGIQTRVGSESPVKFENPVRPDMHLRSHSHDMLSMSSKPPRVTRERAGSHTPRSPGDFGYAM